MQPLHHPAACMPNAWYIPSLHPMSLSEPSKAHHVQDFLSSKLQVVALPDFTGPSVGLLSVTLCGDSLL